MHSHPYFFMHARGKIFKSHIWKKAFFFSARLSIYKKPQRQRRRSATQQQNGDRQGKYEERAKSRGSVCRLCNRKKKKQATKHRTIAYGHANAEDGWKGLQRLLGQNEYKATNESGAQIKTQPCDFLKECQKGAMQKKKR